MKAYKNVKGEIRLFRPDCNALRFKKSSVRLSLPDFDGEELIRLVEQFILTEERWIPPISEFSYYIRPLHIATEPSLGVKKPSQTKLLVMGGPVGPYYPTGFKPISLSCTESSIRSAPKGTGAFKIGGYSLVDSGITLRLSRPPTWCWPKATSKSCGSTKTRSSRWAPPTSSSSSKTASPDKSKSLLPSWRTSSFPESPETP